MDLDKLNEFIKFMDDNQLTELEIEEEGKRIKLKKESTLQPVVSAQPPIHSQNTQEEIKKNITVEIQSPMVGTFYRAPSPGAKSYIEIGDFIKPGEVVCIIEAMKLMNEIKAEVGGKVVQIPVENGEPVEFGQTLFAIEPA